MKPVFSLLPIILFIFSCGVYLDQQEQAEREKYVQQNTQLDSQTKQDVVNKVVRVGMDAYSVIAAWGNPDDYTTSVGAGGNVAIFYYKHMDLHGYYKTNSVVYLQQDSDGVYRVTRITSLD